ncbi:MAG: RidA family protein [Clostridia bacterium]|nr:RidA family protein [Clostridia bacterium]
MTKTVVTDKAPAAIGPYSQAKIFGNLVFASGQIPINPETGNMEDTTIEGQTERVCQNVEALLEAAGTSIEKVIKTTCFLSDMADFSAFNAVYEKHFTSKPARSCVAVREIPKGAKVEIEVTAEI